MYLIVLKIIDTVFEVFFIRSLLLYLVVGHKVLSLLDVGQKFWHGCVNQLLLVFYQLVDSKICLHSIFLQGKVQLWLAYSYIWLAYSYIWLAYSYIW